MGPATTVLAVAGRIDAVGGKEIQNREAALPH
jgi:hypothetical protein